jgi:HlyD family secretion protein
MRLGIAVSTSGGASLGDGNWREMETANDKKKWLKWATAALVLAAVGAAAWRRYGVDRSDDGLASGNGRIEATEIDAATKITGRVKEILAREGDFVTAGQVVAQMDTEALEAQVREATARMQETRSTARTARSQLAQREAERAAAAAVIGQREAEPETSISNNVPSIYIPK